jgi:Flp pilus assembly protein TadG
MPVILMFIMLAIAAGRIHTARAAVDAAAREAARSASISRTPGAAEAAARTAATGSLGQQGVHCSSRSVAVDTSGFGVPIGQVGTVRVTVDCTVPLESVALVSLPGSLQAHSEFTSVVDRYRSRDGGG